jgi:DNA polymerase III epsilon subunit-like protein
MRNAAGGHPTTGLSGGGCQRPGGRAQVLHVDASTPDDTPLNRVGWAVVDVETTGFDADADEIVQVAVTHVEPDGTVTGTWSTLVRPQRTGPDGLPAPGPTHVHGITAEDLADRGADPATVAAQLAARLDGRVVAGHNIARFDFRFLDRLLEAYGHPKASSHPYADTLQLSREAAASDGGVDALAANHNLAAVCARHNVPHAHAHTAAGDAEATARVLFVLVDRVGARTVGDLRRTAANPYPTLKRADTEQVCWMTGERIHVGDLYVRAPRVTVEQVCGRELATGADEVAVRAEHATRLGFRLPALP